MLTVQLLSGILGLSTIKVKIEVRAKLLPESVFDGGSFKEGIDENCISLFLTLFLSLIKSLKYTKHKKKFVNLNCYINTEQNSHRQ